MKLNFGNILYIILFSSLIGLAVNFIRPEGISLIREEKEITWADSIENENEDFETATTQEPVAINLEQAYKLYQNNVVFLDAREQLDFLDAHIKGSMNLPFDDFDANKNILNNLSKDEPIITYCGGDDCDLSILLGNKLFEMGYKKVYVFFGGWNEWLAAGYPIEEVNFN